MKCAGEAVIAVEWAGPVVRVGRWGGERVCVLVGACDGGDVTTAVGTGARTRGRGRGEGGTER